MKSTNMKNTFHIVFAGGGTGGHLFPGLAVAKKLSANRPGVRITFVGTGKPLERQHVAAAGFDYVPLPSRPLPRRASEAISFVVENVAGYFAAGRLLDEEHVAGVVGLGGYASVPMGRAAGTPPPAAGLAGTERRAGQGQSLVVALRQPGLHEFRADRATDPLALSGPLDRQPDPQRCSATESVAG